VHGRVIVLNPAVVAAPQQASIQAEQRSPDRDATFA
jgi:hypothetical protein